MGIVFTDSLVTISCLSPEYILQKFEIFIESSLRFTVRVYGWLLMDDHDTIHKSLNFVYHLLLNLHQLTLIFVMINHLAQEF